MPRFLIERDIPGASELTEEQLAEITEKSNASMQSLGVPYRWITSFVAGDKVYFDIVHQDWGEVDPPTFDRHIVAQVVQNEMIAAILGNNVVIDPANPPAPPQGRGFTLVGPIAPSGTRGNSSEGVDVWGPDTGSGIKPPSGRTPILPGGPGR